MIRYLLTIILISALFALPALGAPPATERLKLIVGGDHENPPFEFLENGRPSGFNVELMRAVAETIGADVEFRLGPWSKVRNELERGKIDALAGMYYSVERSRMVEFSVPHTMVSAGLFVRGNSPIRSFDDIKGKEIIVQKGDVIDDYLRENGISSRIVDVTDPKDELRLLASGRNDAALMPSRFQGEYLKRSLGLTNIRVIGADLPQFRYCFAVRKGNSALRYRLDEGLNILKVNGKYKEIYEKWFGIYEKKELWQTLRYFVWALALISTLLMASFIWSWTLRRQVRIRTAELREREENLRFTQYAIDKSIDQAFWMIKDARLFYVNDAACRTLGYTREELLKLSIPDIDPIYQPDKFAEHWRYLQENGYATFETVHRAKGGRVYPVEIRANYVVFDYKEYNCAFATDISERKRMEEDLRHAYDDLEKRVEERTAELAETVGALQKEIVEREKAEKSLHHLNRTLRTLIKCSEALAHADNEDVLMGRICRIITEDGGYRFAWVGFAENDEARTVRPVAHAGYEDGYLESLGITWSDAERGRCPVGAAIRESTPCLVNDTREDPRFLPWREEAGKHGYISVLSAPLFGASRIIGALSIYASEPDAFDEEEVKLMEQLARDLSFGIRSLRTAAARRRFEEALLKSEKNLAEAQAIAHLGSWEYDLEKKEGYWSDEFVRILGLDHRPTSLVIDSLINFIHPEEREYVREKVRATLQEGSLYDLEYRIVRPDGVERVVHARGKTVDDGEGRIIRFIGSSQDITERKRLEEELRESEARLKLTMELAKLGAWEYDVSTSLFSFDDQFYSLYGTTAEREGGTLMPAEVYARKFIPPEESAIVANGIAEVQANLSIQLEHRIIRADGEERFIIVRAEAVFNQEGLFVKIRGANQDITERKLAEERLQRKRAQLEELNRTLETRVLEEVTKNREKDIILIQQNRQAALGELLDHIAHQWKQPLNVINLIIYDLGETYARGGLTNKYIRTNVDKIMSLTQHMAQTIEVFRNFYKPEKEKKLFRVKEPIDQAVSFVAPALRFYSIALELEVDPDLSAIGYPKEYAQVLLNILSNARDAFKERGVKKPLIEIRAFADGKNAVVTITDNAGGIPDPNISKIFDIYFTTKEVSGGTGIGLHMSKNIIEKNMGGTLSVVNVEQGAQFRIEVNMPEEEETIAQ
jgi:PAS domain S-box-containing protein